MKSNSRVPIVTLILIAANIFAAFALVWQPEMALKFGFMTARPTVQTAFTSLFLHLNLLHLLGNMVFLAAVGPAVESAAGSWRFAVVYFAGGIGGVATHLLMSPKTSSMPLIGASACIAACIAYCSIRYMHMRAPIAPNASAPVLAIITFWVALQVIGGFVTFGLVQTGTAYWAHIGGFLTGILFGLIFRAPKLADHELGHDVMKRMDGRSAGAKLAAIELHLKSHPDDLEALRQKAAALALVDDNPNEAKVLVSILDRLPESEQNETLHRLSAIHSLDALPSLRRTLLADRCKLTEPELAKDLLRSVIERPDDAQRPDALLALVALCRSKSEDCSQWLTALYEEYPLHPACDLAKTRGWTP